MSDINGLKRPRSSSPTRGVANGGNSKKLNTGNSNSANSGESANAVGDVLPNPSASTSTSTSAVAGGGRMAVDPVSVKSEDNVVPDDNHTPATGSRQGPADSGSSVPAAVNEGQAAVEASAPSITIRALIVTQDASVIIGKAGSHIKEIRDRAGARVSVSEQQPNVAERVLHVTGPLDAVSKAYGLIVRKINDEPYDQASAPGSRSVTIKRDTLPAAKPKYIIPNSRMGSVIGKGGSKIKEIQEASGARLQASDTMLAGSTERVLSVCGVADAVHIAVYYVGTILQEGSDRPQQQNIPYRPGPVGGPGGGPLGYAPGLSAYNAHAGSGGSRYGASGGAGGSFHGGAGAGFGGASAAYGYGGPVGGGGGGTYAGAMGGGAGMAASGMGHASPYSVTSTAAAVGSQTQQIYVPNDLVGNIIGKGGQKINEIRQLSGCSIKIMELTESQGNGARQGERLVTITGLPTNIQTAVQMLHARLESEKAKKMQQPAVY